MLRRAASSRHARVRLRHDLLQSYHQLHLPFLCPVYASRLEHVRGFTRLAAPHNAQHRPLSRRNSLHVHNQSSKLGFATAETPSFSSFEDVPFEGLPSKYNHQLGRSNGIEQQRHRAAAQLVILPIQAAPVLNVRAAPYQPFSANLMELQTNLYACLKVGRFERAAAIARRISYVYVSHAPEVIDAHEHYLGALLDVLIDSPKKSLFTDMQRWLELEVRGKDTPVTVGMLAIMIKGTLSVHSGHRMERTLRRYFLYAKEANMLEEVNASSLYTEEEYAQLIRLQSDSYHRKTEVVPDSATDGTGSTLQMDQLPETQRETSKSLAQTVTEVEDMSDLRETQQKGGSLEGLKSSVKALEEWRIEALHKAQISDADLEELQLKLEQGVADATLQRWRAESAVQKAVKRDALISSASSFGTLSYEWIKDMVPLLEEEIRLGEESEEQEEIARDQRASGDRLVVTPFLKMGNPEQLCAVAVIHFLRAAAGGEVRGNNKDIKVSHLVMGMGKQIVQELRFEEFTQSMTKKRKLSLLRRRDLTQLLKKNQLKHKVHQEQTATEAGEDATTNLTHSNIPVEISQSTAVKIGACFLSWILKVARIPVTKTHPETKEVITHWQPAATHGHKWDSGKKMTIVKMNLELLKRLQKEPIVSLACKSLPMIVKPRPWTAYDKGAYLQTKTKAIRFKDPSRNQEAHVKLASKRGDMKQVFGALDSLGAVPWMINQQLFKVMTEVWNTGEELTGFAPADYKPELPPKPAQQDPVEYHRWRHDVNLINNQIYSFHSQRCYQNLQMQTAKSFQGLKFYTPHSVDFRGRAYPIPPYLNHMGSDLTRGLFLFAEGKKLGEKGLSWLKIHVANTFGFDKESLREREAWTMENIRNIYQSVENPMGGSRWWMTAEDPWQCLAACMELKSALDSPVPSEYVSHLPIHQDGTCNGLQHYAALGGDEIGAKQVNLAPGDKPSDVYSAVADLVKEQVKLDASNGHTVAKFLDGRITRKVVKQPVMTNVYGVTYYGARAQVKKRLMEIIDPLEVPKDVTTSEAAGYIANNIFKALATMFEGASAIQHWLGECGGAISQAITPEQIGRIKSKREGTFTEKPYLREKLYNSTMRKKVRTPNAEDDCQFKSTIIWTTPLGLPVVQPYREVKASNVVTSLSELQYIQSTVADPVSKRRQLQAFPPNFIHSLDATHMMLSALKCEEVGVTFASVHDSFWTHAADIPTMNRVLRDAFIRMHGEDIVGRLREEFMARYKGCLQIVFVAGDSPVGKRILEMRQKQKRGRFGAKFSPEEASKCQIDELCTEHDRLEMLKSDDPEERERAREMETPYSLYEEDTEGTQAQSRNKIRVRSFTDQSDDEGLDASTQEVEIEGRDEPAASLEAELFGSEDSEFDLDEDIIESEVAEASETRSRRKKGSSKVPSVYFWMPLTFPEPPSKGAFNVADLKGSQYFFS